MPISSSSMAFQSVLERQLAPALSSGQLAVCVSAKIIAASHALRDIEDGHNAADWLGCVLAMLAAGRHSTVCSAAHMKCAFVSQPDDMMVHCRLNKLAGRRGINKDWDTESGSEAEEEEEVAETGSKGSMNRPSGASSKAQSDAETEHSTQRQRPSSKADARRLLEGRRRWVWAYPPYNPHA